MAIFVNLWIIWEELCLILSLNFESNTGNLHKMGNLHKITKG